MSVFDILSPVSDIIETAGEAIDRNVTSDEERLKARNELRQIEAKLTGKYQDFMTAQQQQLTDRHRSDMQSDSRFAKRVRPATLVCLLLAVVVLAVTDGNIDGFTVRQSWIDLLETLASAAFVFYFGGRSAEKVFSLMKGDRS